MEETTRKEEKSRTETMLAGNGHQPERDKKGRFLKGSSGYIGKKGDQRSRVLSWRRNFVKAITPRDMTRVIHVLRDAAFAGESWAVLEFLNRTLGKSEQRVEITGEDGKAIEHEVTLRLTFDDPRAMREATVRVEAPALLEAVDEAQPAPGPRVGDEWLGHAPGGRHVSQQ